MHHVTVIATSLNSDSKSQILARRFQSLLERKGISHDLVDLRELNLPFAGTAEGWESADAAKLRDAVERASHIVFATPIYCYDVNSAGKNVIELIGRSFTRKIVAFICSAGGNSSYMAVMGMANHLMLDFRSVIVPRFLYVDSGKWADDGTLDPGIEGRLEKLLQDMASISVTPVEDDA